MVDWPALAYLSAKDAQMKSLSQSAAAIVSSRKSALGVLDSGHSHVKQNSVLVDEGR